MKVTVKLWIRPGKDDAFQRYEAAAFEIMKGHGIEILNIQRRSGAEAGEPDEVHHLRCPNAGALEAYRDDPRLKALADLREQAISRTEITTDADQ